MRDVELSCPHYLSGPIAIEDAAGEPAHPGDLLVVDILDIGALEGFTWGFTGKGWRAGGGQAGGRAGGRVGGRAGSL
jgi:formamidase